MTHFMKTVRTPAGNLALATTETAVVALVWDKQALKRIGVPSWKEGPTCALLEKAERQLLEYLEGKRSRFDLPLEFQGTAFQKRVWAELGKIPYGRTWSYQELARRVGSPKAVRAVGSANGKNPVCIFVPCHRVVRATGKMGGYTGGIDKKAFLLDLEAAPQLPL